MNSSHPPSSRRKRSEGGWGRALVALLLTLLGHVAFLGLLVLLSELAPPAPPHTPKPPPQDVSLRSLSADQWARNRGNSRPLPPGTPPAPKQKAVVKVEPKPPEKPQGQVVDTAPGNDEVSPDAKYLAESNNRVEKESRAREQTANYRNAAPRAVGPNPEQASRPRQAEAGGNAGVGSDERPATPQQRKAVMEIPEARKRDAVALKTNPETPGPGASVPNRTESENMDGNAKRLRIEPGTQGTQQQEGSLGRAGKQGLASLMPSAESMSRIVGAAPNDDLRGEEEGDATLLNTREWKYASFFNRLKQRVAEQWNPSKVLQMRDPTGNTYSGRDRQTLLAITMDQSGRVTDVKVEKSSGLDFLDLEAVQSFERAQPFPNPPAGLMGPENTVTFNFGFFLEMGGPRMRIFRPAN